MIELDGTPDKSRLGANAMLAVSCATARAIAGERWCVVVEFTRKLVAGMDACAHGEQSFRAAFHAGRNIEFQDFLVVAHGFDTYTEALHGVTRVDLSCPRLVLEARGYLGHRGG